MDSIKQIKQSIDISNNTKGHKIIAALYLVTQHLSDSEPLKSVIRAKSLTLLEEQSTIQKNAALQICTMLEAAVLAHMVSEKNASIIILEIDHFIRRLSLEDEATIEAFFLRTSETDRRTIKKTSFTQFPAVSRPIQSDIHKTLKSTIYISENKNKRQETILSFINDRKSAGIKDISLLFPDVSEKTIQRELGTLVLRGKITKRGSKRWSVYMAI